MIVVAKFHWIFYVHALKYEIMLSESIYTHNLCTFHICVCQKNVIENRVCKYVLLILAITCLPEYRRH